MANARAPARTDLAVRRYAKSRPKCWRPSVEDFPGNPGRPSLRTLRALTLRLGDETLELVPGSFACVPPGTVHTFSNHSEQPARFLNFNTPGGWENYMRDLAGALAAGSPTPEEIGKIASRYDFRPV